MTDQNDVKALAETVELLAEYVLGAAPGGNKVHRHLVERMPALRRLVESFRPEPEPDEKISTDITQTPDSTSAFEEEDFDITGAGEEPTHSLLPNALRELPEDLEEAKDSKEAKEFSGGDNGEFSGEDDGAHSTDDESN